MIADISGYILEDYDDLSWWYRSWFSRDDDGTLVAYKLRDDMMDVDIQLLEGDDLNLPAAVNIAIKGERHMFFKHFDVPITVGKLNKAVRKAIKISLSNYATNRAQELIVESRHAMGEGRE